MSDIRLKATFWTHPKTLKLKRRLGADGVLALIRLWSWCGCNRPKGVLDGMDSEDVEIAAEWTGDPGALVGALVDLRFIDQDGERFMVHDWEQHQPYAFKSEERSAVARELANRRWSKRVEKLGLDANGNANGTAKGNAKRPFCDAPVPAPVPAPTSTPSLFAKDANDSNGVLNKGRRGKATAEVNGGAVWAMWCDLHKGLGLRPPVKVGKDLSAAKNLAGVEDLDAILRAYLADDDQFIAKQGHALSLLPGRINFYIQKAAKLDSVKCTRAEALEIINGTSQEAAS